MGWLGGCGWRAACVGREGGEGGEPWALAVPCWVRRLGWSRRAGGC